MKKIYFNTTGSYDFILSNDDPHITSNGFYLIKDILGREYYVPISCTFMYVEEFDGNITNLGRYDKILKELKGEETGLVRKNDK
jgi:hypothetical protein